MHIFTSTLEPVPLKTPEINFQSHLNTYITVITHIIHYSYHKILSSYHKISKICSFKGPYVRLMLKTLFCGLFLYTKDTFLMMNVTHVNKQLLYDYFNSFGFNNIQPLKSVSQYCCSLQTQFNSYLAYFTR